ncbi:MAG: cadmium-translocating P-type ATPase [Bacilli bacterium]|nr:cadmium-translocating P-type ATPase [Bacilli bacterium]
MKKFFNEDLIKILISIVLFISSLFIEENEIKLAFLATSYAIISTGIYINAYNHIKKKIFFNENLLMIIATLCAFAIANNEEAVMVMLLFQVGEYFSHLAVHNSKKSITKLMDLRVDTANLLVDNEIVEVKVKDVEENDILLVKPGEKIPLDGVVIEGESHLDTSSLTGESKPRSVNKDDKVLSGCINKEGVLTIKATSTYKTSTAARILEIIEKSPSKKADTEKFITKFSKVYTPIVIISAILLTVIPVLFGQKFKVWFYRALVFLVTSCPCALVISIPLAYFCGIGRASKEGILIKGSKELENLQSLDYVVLDKTGTITEGVFEVTKVFPVAMKENKFLQLAASAEQYSLHPIALAIKEKNEEKLLEAEKYKDMSGKGISCEVKGKKILVGNEMLMKENKVMTLPISETGTVIHVAIDKEYAGYLVISDKIKKSSLRITELLKYIKKELIIISGDIESVVQKVAKKVGINTYYAEMLPEDKVDKVKEYKKNGKVLFAGDGVNDAPVLKISDIGVSMGQVGSDAAIEASDVVIMKDDLSKIKTAIIISNITKKKVIQTIVFALLVKLVVLILGALGLSTIWMAVFADVGVTFLCILNVLTILWKKLDK